MISQGQQDSITLFQTIAEQLAKRLRPKTKSYFLPLILGVLLAIARRRTVTQWIQACQLNDKYRQSFYHISNIGEDHQELFDEILKIITTQLAAIITTASTIRLVLDDTPTKRYARDGRLQTADDSRNRKDSNCEICRLPSAVCRLPSAKCHFRLLPNCICGKKKSTNWKRSMVECSRRKLLSLLRW